MKQKRKVYFTYSTGRVVNGETIEHRCVSSWKAGRSRNKKGKYNFGTKS